MKIESLIKRKFGTQVRMDDVLYHFQPTDSDPRHIASVTVKSHIQRFLAIPEGYQPAELSDEEREKSGVNPNPVGRTVGGVEGVANPDPSRTALEYLSRNDLLSLAKEAEVPNAEDLEKDKLILAIQRATGDAPPEGFEQNGEGSGAAPLGDLAQINDEGDPDAGDEEDDGTPAGGSDLSDNSGAAPLGDLAQVQEESDGLAAMTRDQLVELYKEKMGRAPNGRMSDDSIRRVLKDDE